VLSCLVGVPYGYVATGSASGGSDRLGGTGAATGAAGTTYYATASAPDFAGTPVGVVSFPRAAATAGQ